VNRRRRVEDLERAIPEVAPGGEDHSARIDQEVERLTDELVRHGRYASREEAEEHVRATLDEVIAEVKAERPGA